MNYRSALERWAQHRRARGWIEGNPPTDQWIEYHATHAQLVYSGRCRIDQLPRDDIIKPGTHQNIFLSQGMAQIRFMFWRPSKVEVEWGPRCMDLISGETRYPIEK